MMMLMVMMMSMIRRKRQALPGSIVDVATVVITRSLHYERARHWAHRHTHTHRCVFSHTYVCVCEDTHLAWKTAKLLIVLLLGQNPAVFQGCFACTGSWFAGLIVTGSSVGAFQSFLLWLSAPPNTCFTHTNPNKRTSQSGNCLEAHTAIKIAGKKC